MPCALPPSLAPRVPPQGLDPVAETLEQLWVSYNQIQSLAGIEKLSGLQVLFMSNNKIDKWSEVERLTALPKLRDLLLHGNPITDQFKEVRDRIKAERDKKRKEGSGEESTRVGEGRAVVKLLDYRLA